MSEHYIIINIILNMFFLACNLFVDELTKLHNQKQLANFINFFDFQNIFHADMKILANKINMFNQHHVQQIDIIIIYSFATADSARNFADIKKYVINAENNFDFNFMRLILNLNIDLN